MASSSFESNYDIIFVFSKEYLSAIYICLKIECLIFSKTPIKESLN